MMKSVARFTTRLQGEGDGLFVGALLTSGKGLLTPNSVYEIRDVLGQLVVVKLGEAAGSNEAEGSPVRDGGGWIGFHWGHQIGELLSIVGSKLFLTREQFKEVEEAERALGRTLEND